MRINARNGVEAAVIAKFDPPRVQMKFGSVWITATVEEAVELAGELLDAVEGVRNGNP